MPIFCVRYDTQRMESTVSQYCAYNIITVHVYIHFTLHSSGYNTILVKFFGKLEEMVASSGSRYTVLHKTDSAGKMYHYGNVKSDMANACLKHIRVRY
jgi:hypothetical protein